MLTNQVPCRWWMIRLLVFYILATSNVIPGWIPTCDSARSWLLHNAAPPGDQATNSMTRYPTQSYYPDTEPTSPSPILIMRSTWLRLFVCVVLRPSNI